MIVSGSLGHGATRSIELVFAALIRRIAPDRDETVRAVASALEAERHSLVAGPARWVGTATARCVTSRTCARPPS